MRDLIRAASFLITIFLVPLSVVRADEPCSDISISWPKLKTEFDNGKLPTKQSLIGKWIMIGHVVTKEFKGGRNSIDTNEFNCAGLRGDGKRYWDETFTGSEGEQIQFDKEGLLLIIDPDDMSDVTITYRCRMSDFKKLVCVYQNAPGMGVEFRME